jgi:AcrR family transcriptional regulator
VLATARALLAEGGPPALSLRAVARRLGVAPNALYSHIAGTTDLLDAVLDDVLSAVPAPRPDAEPRAGLTALLLDTYDVLVRHVELVPLYLARQGVRGEQGQRLGAVMDELLELAGVDEVGAARRVLIVHVMGSAAFASSTRDPDAALSSEEARELFARSRGWLLAGLTTTSS